MRRILIAGLVLLLATGAFYNLFPTAEAAEQRELWWFGDETVTDDALVDEGDPTANFGGVGSLQVTNKAIADDIQSFIRLDISLIPADVTINRFVLYLYFDLYENCADTDDWTIVHANRVTASWDEGTITWNTRPAVSATVNASARHFTHNQGLFEEFDLTSLARAWYDGTFSNFGIRLDSALQDDCLISWRSKEGIPPEPRVQLIYTTGDTLVYISIFDSTIGEGFAFETFRVLIDFQRQFTPLIGLVNGTTYTATVEDFFGNEIHNATFVPNADPFFLDIGLAVYSWKLTNIDFADYLLANLTFNGSAIDRSQFVLPMETIAYWLRNGDYTLNLTHYDGNVIEETTQIFFTIASAAQALTVSDDFTVRRITGDLSGVGTNVLEVWDNTNKTFVAVGELDTPAGLAIVYDTYYIPPTNMMDLLSKDLVPGEAIDPFRTLIYDILSTSEGTGRLTLNKPFDTGLDEDDVTMMQDDLHAVVVSGSLTRWWLNDTKDTATTSDDTIVLNITYTGFFDLTQFGDGLNLSVETEGTASLNLTRVSQVRFVSTFLWTRDTVTRQYLMTTSLENTLALPWSNVNLYIAFPQTADPDSSTVVVRDVTASVDLEKGIHYDLTDGGVYLALTTLASNEIKTWRIIFFDNVLGTSILEPRCSFGRVSQQRRGLVDMQRVEVACVNENAFDYRGRIVLVFDPSRAVRHDSIIVEDLSGQLLSNTAYWNDRDTLILTGVGVDSLETLQLVVWFRYASDIIAITDLLPWLPIIGLVFAAFAIISYVGWSRQPKGSSRQERARVATILFGILAVISFILLVFLQISQGI